MEHSTITTLRTLKPRDAGALLFRRFFDHVVRSGRQIPVDDFVMGRVFEFRDAIIAGEPVHAMFGMWSDIFEAIKWDAKKPDEAIWCGFDALSFAGYFGEYLQWNGATCLPLPIAFHALMYLQPQPKVLGLNGSGDRTWIEVLPEGVEALGLRGRLILRHRLPDFETLPELFQNGLDDHSSTYLKMLERELRDL